MAEYTYEDIIINPEDPRLEGAIGKECYLSDCPKIALDYARHNSLPDRLKSISKESAAPFVSHDETKWVVVIIKKEEPKPEYVPFENAEEFLNAYDYTNHSIENGSLENKLINYGGIWLKDKETDAFFMVTEIWDEGVVIGDSKIKTIKNGDDEYFTMNDVTDWRELLRDFAFLDGSPCGKEVK